MPEEEKKRGVFQWESIAESARQLGVGFVLAGGLAIFLDLEAGSAGIGSAGLAPVALGWMFLVIGWIR